MIVCVRACVFVRPSAPGVSIRSGRRLLWAMGKQLRGTGECVTEAFLSLCNPLSLSHMSHFPMKLMPKHRGARAYFKESIHINPKHRASVQR